MGEAKTSCRSGYGGLPLEVSGSGLKENGVLDPLKQHIEDVTWFGLDSEVLEEEGSQSKLS